MRSILQPKQQFFEGRRRNGSCKLLVHWKKNDIMDLLADIRIPIQTYQNNYRSNPQAIHGALTHTKKQD